MNRTTDISQRFESLAPFLDERLRRLVAAAEARSLGGRGVAAVSRATGVSRRAISRGLRELDDPPPEEGARTGRIRKPGGGRKRTTDSDPSLESDLETLIDPVTRGDPESPLRWTCKSVRRLADEPRKMGHKTSHRMVAELLHKMGYSLQANAKTLEGGDHADRNLQFEHIHREILTWMSEGQPVISVNTKKKELVGDFRNGGRELGPKKNPEKDRVPIVSGTVFARMV